MTTPGTLPRLNAELLKEQPSLISSKTPGGVLPEKILQFGEGNFLRGFVDWMINGMNHKGLFGGSVVIVQPVAQGLVSKLNEQSGLYTLLLRGVQNGKVVEKQQVINSISRGVNPYTDFQGYLQCAHNPDLRFIVSNTTEAGIAYVASDRPTDQPPSSYPGKLTLLLLERYKAFKGDLSKGFVLLPCELIDRNGDNLKKTVLETADNWKMEPAFIEWIQKANIFTNTLVDRIVVGYPRGEAEGLWKKAGYQDDLFDCAEVFHLWVIEAPASVAAEFPLKEAGFNVVWTDNMKPYRDRKVRILNGAHTSSVFAAYLAGKNYVAEIMDDPLTFDYMKKAVHQEIIPTLTLPKAELEAFAAAVFERFRNPFINHELLSISLNSVSKYNARVLPSLERYAEIHGEAPAHLSFGLASLIAFYHGTEIRGTALIGLRDGKEYNIKDDLAILKTFAELWSHCDGSPKAIAVLTDTILQQSEWWGRDLREIKGLSDAVTGYLISILKDGMVAALGQIAPAKKSA
jgi:tagaturonate reductase